MRSIAGVLLLFALATPLVARAGAPARPEDFRCLLDGVKPAGQDFYVFNRHRKALKRAVAMIESGRVPKHGYPAGTILQVLPFEAMVQRSRRFNRAGNGWEFVKLSITPDGRTEVVQTGRDEVANGLGSCQACHQRVASDHDLVCGFVIGAAGLGLSDATLQALQASDPRCRQGAPAP